MKMKQPVQRPARKQGERGIILMLGILSFAVVIPMIGLAVDVGYLYASKARLQASVDGASLAAARALNLGSSTSAQAASAQQNAVNWFYSNFSPGNWATTNTVMSTSTVQVYDDAINPNLRHVDVVASTRVPTYFMKYMNTALHIPGMITGTNINAKGHATRRDAVVMLVLDRSGSMCSPSSSPCNTQGACGPMKAAAKLFTGQFAAGRDYIGLLSFSDGSFIHSPPVQSFRTVLGYTEGATSGSGAIDTIRCQGGTGTALAVAMGYNALYQRFLPGAFNVLVLETDGLPNTLSMNMWDGSAFAFAPVPDSSGTPRGCYDANGVTEQNGGWNTYANRRLWRNTTFSMNTITTNTPHAGFVPDIPTGAIGSIYSTDPAQTDGFTLMANPFHTSGNQGLTHIDSVTSNCRFNNSGAIFQSSNSSKLADFAWLPGTDIMGNSVRPAGSLAYKTSFSLSSGRMPFNTGMSFSSRWSNFHDGALNATDHAAYRARTNAQLPATVFVIGLGGQGADPTDHTLLQRIANDNRGDATVPYAACAANPSCVHYDNQPKGTYIYSSDSSVLKQKFLELSSQILRLSQ